MITLIDTSAWVEALRTKGDEHTRMEVAALLESGNARLTEPVMLELWNGARGKAETGMLREIQGRVPLLRCNEAVFVLAYDFARRCRTRGLTVPSVDVLIFAVSRHYKAALLQRDAHFARIADVVR